MFKQDLVFQIVRFGVVGGLVTGVFMGLNRWLGPAYGKNKAFLMAYPPAVALHYCLNKWWTFEDRAGTTAQELGQYVLLTAVAFGIQWGGFQLLTRHTKMKPWLAAGAATVAQMALAFVAMRVWVFATG